MRRASVEQTRDEGGFGTKGRERHRTVAAASVCRGSEKGCVCGMGKGWFWGLGQQKHLESAKVSRDKTGAEVGPNPAAGKVRCVALCCRNTPPVGLSCTCFICDLSASLPVWVTERKFRWEGTYPELPAWPMYGL